MLTSATEESEMVLPRGLAPRSSAFAERRASLTLRELEKWCAMPVLPRRPRFGRPPCFCYTNDALKMVAAFGIAPNSPRLQRGANLSQLRSRGPSARYRAAVSRLSARALLLSYGGMKNGRPTR